MHAETHLVMDFKGVDGREVRMTVPEASFRDWRSLRAAIEPQLPDGFEVYDWPHFRQACLDMKGLEWVGDHLQLVKDV